MLIFAKALKTPFYGLKGGDIPLEHPGVLFLTSRKNIGNFVGKLDNR